MSKKKTLKDLLDYAITNKVSLNGYAYSKLPTLGSSCGTSLFKPPLTTPIHSACTLSKM